MDYLLRNNKKFKFKRDEQTSNFTTTKIVSEKGHKMYGINRTAALPKSTASEVFINRIRLHDATNIL